MVQTHIGLRQVMMLAQTCCATRIQKCANTKGLPTILNMHPNGESHAKRSVLLPIDQACPSTAPVSLCVSPETGRRAGCRSPASAYKQSAVLLATKSLHDHRERHDGLQPQMSAQRRSRATRAQKHTEMRAVKHPRPASPSRLRRYIPQAARSISKVVRS